MTTTLNYLGGRLNCFLTVALERELAFFNSKLSELKAEHEGKFVLVHGEDIIDFFSSYDDAIKAGYARFPLEPFLVKQVAGKERA
jgi:hypothetical protein